MILKIDRHPERQTDYFLLLNFNGIWFFYYYFKMPTISSKAARRKTSFIKTMLTFCTTNRQMFYCNSKISNESQR